MREREGGGGGGEEGKRGVRESGDYYARQSAFALTCAHTSLCAALYNYARGISASTPSGSGSSVLYVGTSYGDILTTTVTGTAFAAGETLRGHRQSISALAADEQ